MSESYIYILAHKKNGTLYVGMTGNISKRVIRHQEGEGSKFVQKYKVCKLVYYEKVNSYQDARDRERQLK